jgi:hypothetical protein
MHICTFLHILESLLRLVNSLLAQIERRVRGAIRWNLSRRDLGD